MQKIIQHQQPLGSMRKIWTLALILLAFSEGGFSKEVGKAVTKSRSAEKQTLSKSEVQSPLQLQVIKMDGADGKDIVEVASSSKDHTSLTAAVKAADLVETLSGAGPYTIFAPTDAAFAKVPKATVESLFKPENKSSLRALLEHHAAAPAYKPEILSGLTELDMVDGPKLKVMQKDGKLFVDDVEIKAAIAAKNGIIYVVDSVLVAK